jgi:uncharacterized protein YciI
VIVVSLRYLKSSEVILENRSSHLEFLQKYYDLGIFLTSGRLNSGNGGIILATGKSRDELIEIFTEDSFFQNGCAEYQYFEFTPNNSRADLKILLGL